VFSKRVIVPDLPGAVSAAHFHDRRREAVTVADETDPAVVTCADDVEFHRVRPRVRERLLGQHVKSVPERGLDDRDSNRWWRADDDADIAVVTARLGRGEEVLQRRERPGVGDVGGGATGALVRIDDSDDADAPLACPRRRDVGPRDCARADDGNFERFHLSTPAGETTQAARTPLFSAPA
jgi:hypothetical protein